MKIYKKWDQIFWFNQNYLLEWKTYVVSEYNPPKNYEQLKLYWALLTLVERESGNDKDDMHELMKLKYNRKRIKSNLWGKKSWKYVGGSTKELNRKQFSEYFSHVERFFAELGYVLPPRDSPEFQSLISNYE